MNQPLLAPAPGDARWLRVVDASAAAGCRSAALALATRLQFPANRTDQLVLAVSEAATNLHKHASEGSMLLRVARGNGKPGIEMVTTDSGPGLRDASTALRDGHSTSGSLGIALGVVQRLADFYDLYSVPGRGTALVARFWPGPQDAGLPYAGLVRPVSGETECGDVVGAAETDRGITGVLCDGLGHGPQAASAAMEAVNAVLDDPSASPATLVERAHRRMAHTRGGAIGVVRLRGPLVLFAGLGNITAVILSAGARKGMISVPGIAGHQASAIRQFEYAATPAAAVILHSDGISARWDAAALPGLNSRDPLVIAAALLAQAGSHRHDAGLLVLRP
jgi:anti-sigma regulatory factor (Ser/Thr protein kinase)